MASKPVMPQGYLGPQAKFSEFGLSTVSHGNPEIVTNTNQVEVKIGMGKPAKVTANLTCCSSNEELPQHVFTQTTNNDVISFLVSLPAVGYYKLQVFALLLPDDSKTLPGVFNYLINCTNVNAPVLIYPKQFAQWKVGCYMPEPISLTGRSSLNGVKFAAFVPNSVAAAVVADGSWSHLEKNAKGLWEGKVDLERFRGKDTKVTLNVNYGEENKFSTMLEYKI